MARDNINCQRAQANLSVFAMSTIDRFDPFEGKLGFALASRIGELVFVSGMTGVDIETDTVPNDLAGQMRQAYKNIAQILAHYGTSLANTIEQTIFFVGEAATARAAYDVVCAETFGHTAPAATMVGVTMLVEPRYQVEIKVVAAIGDAR
jgi:enamine deaminase RidA (YjgF/YER057c/UK114 family)